MYLEGTLYTLNNASSKVGGAFGLQTSYTYKAPLIHTYVSAYDYIPLMFYYDNVCLMG